VAEKELGLQSENWRKSFLAGQAAGNNTFEHYEEDETHSKYEPAGRGN